MSLIPRKKIFGNPQKTACRVSPDGKWLSWLAPKDGVLNIWIAPIDDMDAAKAITNDQKRGIRFFMWAPNMTHVLYIQDAGGDENWHLFSVDIETHEEKDLTPYEKITAQFQALSWDFPNTALIGLNDRDQSWHDTYKIDLVTGERELVFLNDQNFGDFTYDRNFTLRFAEKPIEGEGGRQVYRYDDGKFEELFKISHDDDLTTSLLGFEHDNTSCYMLDSANRDKASLFKLDWSDGSKELIAEHERADINNIMVHPTSYQIEAYGANFLKQEWHPVGDAVAEDLTFLEESLPGEIGIGSRTKADDVWVVSASTAENPGVYYKYERATKTLTELFSIRPELEDVKLRPMQGHVIKSRDGLDMVSYLTLPTASSETGDTLEVKQAVPLILLVHGGPWARDSYGYNGAHQWLADRGYAVLSVNYRGSTGFGKSFINAANLEWAGKMHDDLLDAVEWAIEKGITDRDKVAIMGGSYGGYATLVGLTFTPDVFVCGVDIVGPSNLQTLIDTIPPYWQAFYENFAKRMGDPRTEEGRKLLQDRSPLNKVDQITKPLLIGQGANDPRVKQSESDQIVAAMTEKNIPVTYVLYPDEGHGFARPENSMSFYATTEAFLGTHLGGMIQPIETDFEGASLEVPAGADQVPGLQENLKG